MVTAIIRHDIIAFHLTKDGEPLKIISLHYLYVSLVTLFLIAVQKLPSFYVKILFHFLEKKGIRITT